MLNLNREIQIENTNRLKKKNLKEFLELNSFYPQGFVPEKIVETRQSTVVVGENYVYKFLKINTPFLNQASYFRLAWQRACEEILDHRILAPTLYQGLRLLRWVNGKPEWISEKITYDLNPLQPPKEADDLAIIMKRVNDEDIIANHFKSNKSFSYKHVTNLSKHLFSFYLLQDKNIHARHFSLTKNIEKFYLSPLKKFIYDDLNYFDDYLKISLTYIYQYLGNYYLNNRQQIKLRQRLGFIIDGHGKLKTDNISITKNNLEFFSRLSRQDPTRVRDVLHELATLTADLELRGLKTFAKVLIDKISSSNPRLFNESLFDFYKVLDISRNCLKELKHSEPNELLNENLTYALRISLNLSKPFLLVVDYRNEHCEKVIARSFRDLIGTKVVSTKNLEKLYNISIKPDDLQLQLLLDICQRRLISNKSTLLLWPLNREEERILIEDFANLNGIPYLFIHPSSTAENSQTSGKRRMLSNKNVFFINNLNIEEPTPAQAIYNNEISPAEAALSILMTFKKSYKL